MLRIELLGRPRLLVAGQFQRLSAPPRTIPLLAYLILHRARPVRRETVAFTFWPDASEAEARANLRRHMHHLHRVLPPGPHWIHTESAAVQWNTAGPWTADVVEFEESCGSTETREAAVALYRGDLLEGVHDDWVLVERERLRNLYAATLGALVRFHRGRRDYPHATAYAQQLLSHDPLREDACRQLMALRYESGDRGGALDEFQRFARRLRDELGVEPMPETTALYEAILWNRRLPDTASEPAGTPAVGARPQPFPFVGRDTQMHELRDAWSRAARGQGCAVLVGGPAGIGKTRMAAELAVVVESEGGRVLRGATMFPEALPYQAVSEALHAALPLVSALNLNPVSVAPLASLIPELAARRPDLPVLPPLDPGQERARLFGAFDGCLAGLAEPRPLLVVLEDLHLAGAATIDLLEFMALRVMRHPILLLGTYREEETGRDHPLQNLRMRLRRHASLSSVVLRPLTLEAVEQLVSRIEGGSDRLEAEALYETSEGNPFFLGELIREQLDIGQVSGTGTADAAGRSGVPRRVEEIIEMRLSRLSDDSQAVAEIAAVVGKAFGVELVREVSGWPESQILDALAGLLDRQVVRESGPGSDYVFTHHLIQAVVYDRIPPATRRRRHRRVAQVMEELYPDLLDDLSGVLAIHLDRGDEPEHASAFYLRAVRRAQAVYANNEALASLARGLELTKDPRRRFELLMLQEDLHHRLGRRAAQRLDLRQLEEVAGTLGEGEPAFDILLRQIRLADVAGELETQAERIRALKSGAAARGDSRWEAEAAHAEAVYQMRTGELEAARANLGLALRFHQQEENIAAEIRVTCRLAEVALQLGRTAESQELIERARGLAEREGDYRLLLHTLREAMRAVVLQQDYSAALSFAEQFLDLARVLGDQENEADALMGLGVLALRLFRIQEALEHYAAAEAVIRGLGDPRGEARLLLNRAFVAYRLGRCEEAVEFCLRAESVYASVGDRRGVVQSVINLSWAAHLAGDNTAAKAAARKALDLMRRAPADAMEGNATANLGAAERELGEVDEAVRHLETAVAHDRAVGRSGNLVDHLAELALAYLSAGTVDAARRAADEMVPLAEAVMPQFPQHVFWVASQTYRALGDAARAREFLLRAHEELERRVVAIPDTASQAAYGRLSFNRQLTAAYQALTSLG